jgi:hypothetical protein
MAAGWAHYLTFDIFVGRWILFDSIKNRVFAAHSLVLANLFGPVGLLSHLVRPPPAPRPSAIVAAPPDPP